MTRVSRRSRRRSVAWRRNRREFNRHFAQFIVPNNLLLTAANRTISGNYSTRAALPSAVAVLSDGATVSIAGRPSNLISEFVGPQPGRRQSGYRIA